MSSSWGPVAVVNESECLPFLCLIRFLLAFLEFIRCSILLCISTELDDYDSLTERTTHGASRYVVYGCRRIGGRRFGPNRRRRGRVRRRGRCRRGRRSRYHHHRRRGCRRRCAMHAKVNLDSSTWQGDDDRSCTTNVIIRSVSKYASRSQSSCSSSNRVCKYFLVDSGAMVHVCGRNDLPKSACVRKNFRLRLGGAGGHDPHHDGTCSVRIRCRSHKLLSSFVPISQSLPESGGRELDLCVDFQVCDVKEPILSTDLLPSRWVVCSYTQQRRISAAW